MRISNQSTRRALLTAVAAVAAAPLANAASVVTFREGAPNAFTGTYTGTKDASVWVNLATAGLPYNNYGQATTLITRAGSNRWRSILAYDLSALQGLGVTVTDASVTLFKSGTGTDTGNYTYSLYAIAPTNVGWVEGTGTGAHVTAQTGEVTGAWFAAPDPADADPAGVKWRNAAGTEVGDAGSAAPTLLASGPTLQWALEPNGAPYTFTGPDLLAAVQSWIDSPSTNAGVLLSPAGPSVQVNFNSSESTIQSRRPTLNLTLSSPIMTTTLAPGGDVTWSNPANWTGGTPNSVGASATLPASASPRTLTLDGHQVVSNLTLEGNQPYTLAGTSNLRLLEVNTGQATLTAAGSHTIAAPVIASSPTALTVSGASDALSLTGPLTVVTTLTKLGPGTLALGPDAAPSLLASPGTTDLQAGKLTLAYAGPSPVADLRAALAAGRLTTTITPATHAIGYADDGASLLTLIATLKGDANLDGVVNADDLALTDRGFATGGSTWTQGDFNYDATVNEADYLLLDTAYLASHPASPDFLSTRQSQFGDAYVASLLTAIPEPTTALLLTTLPLLTRRRRPTSQNSCLPHS